MVSTNNNSLSIVYGKRAISYRLIYCDRKTMEIAVHPDCTVIVKAPKKTGIPIIENKLLKRARWILKQLIYFKQFDPKTPCRCYVNGETHLYLGKQYRIKLARGTIDQVKLIRGLLHITTRSESTPEVVKKILNKWYLEKMQLQLKESIDRCWPKFNNIGYSKPKIIVKRMKKRWGSFSGRGVMTINVDLIRAPKECIDYVVNHELCHLKFKDHSPEFYNLLGSVNPGWRKIKHKLELKLA